LRTQRGTPLAHVKRVGERVILTGKVDGGIVRASIFPEDPRHGDAMTGVLVGPAQGGVIHAELRVAGREMATRLSYMLWQTMPDAALFQAADAGMLDSNDGVRQQAQKLLEDPKSHPMVAFFFDNLLPIPDLAGLTRDAATFPKWSSTVGVAMRSEVQRVLEYEIYENTTQLAPPYVPGSWPAILTAPYTFVNQSLFSYYGSSTFAAGTASVTGTALGGTPFMVSR